MKQSIPSLPESSLINYIGQVFHINVKACPSFDDVLEILQDNNIHIPGLNVDDSPIFIADRLHLHAAVYNMREGSTLYELLDAFISDQYGGAYIVMADATFTGRDSIFILSVSVDENELEANNQNIGYMPALWGKYGNPVANIITGGCRMKNGDIMSVVAVQLSSLTPKK